MHNYVSFDPDSLSTVFIIYYHKNQFDVTVVDVINGKLR